METTTETAGVRAPSSDADLLARMARLQDNVTVSTTKINTSTRELLGTTALQATGQQDPKLQERRAARLRNIQTLNVDQVEEYKMADQKEIIVAIASLAEASGQIDENFRMLTAPDPEDGAIMARANQAVSDAQAALESAKRNWLAWIFGQQQKGIDAAAKNVTETQKGIKVAELEVQSRISERLRNGNFKVLFNHLQLMTQKVIESMAQKLKANQAELQSMMATKDSAFKDRGETVALMQDLDRKLDELKAEIDTKKETRSTLQADTPEYVTADAEISRLEGDFHTYETSRNSALAKSNELQRFIEGHETQAKALRAINQGLSISLTTLKTDLPHRLADYEAAIKIQDSNASLRIAGKAADVGREVDQRVAEESAAIAAAQMRDALLRVQRSGGAIKAMQDVQKNLVQALIPVMKGMEDEAKKVMENHGLDPNVTSFTTYLDGKEDVQQAA